MRPAATTSPSATHQVTRRRANTVPARERRQTRSEECLVLQAPRWAAKFAALAELCWSRY